MRIIAQTAAGMALLNQKNPKTEILVVGQLVYLQYRIFAKNPNSVRESLAYITHVQENGLEARSCSAFNF